MSANKIGECLYSSGDQNDCKPIQKCYNITNNRGLRHEQMINKAVHAFPDKHDTHRDD